MNNEDKQLLDQVVGHVSEDKVIKVKMLHEDAIIPTYATPGSAGFDLCCVENITINPGETVPIPTGLAFEIPEGYEIQIRPRSGHSLKTKLRVANSPGTIDADYRGEVKVIMENTDYVRAVVSQGHDLGADGGYPISIKKGTKIAQAVLCYVPKMKFEVVEALSDTKRGGGGFGSTGS